MKARRGESLRKSHFILVCLFCASGLTCLRNVVSEYFCSVHVLQLRFQMKMKTNRFVKNIGPLFFIFFFFLHDNCLAHMTCPLQKKIKIKKTIKVRVLLLQMQEGDLCLQPSLASMMSKCFLSQRTLYCEKGGRGGRLIKNYEKYERGSSTSVQLQQVRCLRDVQCISSEDVFQECSAL